MAYAPDLFIISEEAEKEKRDLAGKPLFPKEKSRFFCKIPPEGAGRALGRAA